METAVLKSAARALLFLALAAAALAPALASPQLFSQYYDWRYFDTTAEIARRTVLWYHQMPLWNPYSCGGEVDLANPQSMAAAPTFLLVLLFGTALGTKLALLVYYTAALDGTYRLARHLGCGGQGALLSACGYGLSGYLGMHLASGHSNFAGVALYPYLLLFYDRSISSRRFVVPLGLIAAWIAVLGGTFTPPMAGILLLLWGSMRAVELARAARQQAVGKAAVLRAAVRPFLILLLGGALALCFGAARMLPALEFIHDHPRRFTKPSEDFSWPHQVLLDVLSWRTYGGLPGRKYWAHEYSARLPLLLLPLWLLSLRLLRRAVVLRLWILALLAALLAMGNFLPLGTPEGHRILLPWSFLQRLPVLRDLRVPSRHLVLVILPLALLSGLCWESLRPRPVTRDTRDRRRAAIFAVLFLLTAADGAGYSASLWRGQFTVAVPVPPAPVPFSYVTGHWRTMREDVFAGHGTLGCDEEAPLQRAAALDTGEVPQARLQDMEAGEVQVLRWTPNQRDLRVVLRRGTVLLLNSNWNEHWRLVAPTGADAAVIKVEGRLAVDLRALPAGEHRISVRYAPRSFTVGVALSALSIPLALGFFLRRRRRAGSIIGSP